MLICYKVEVDDQVIMFQRSSSVSVEVMRQLVASILCKKDCMSYSNAEPFKVRLGSMQTGQAMSRQLRFVQVNNTDSIGSI